MEMTEVFAKIRAGIFLRIPQNIADKIFQPFLKTKPTGEGTGLPIGLATGFQ